MKWKGMSCLYYSSNRNKGTLEKLLTLFLLKILMSNDIKRRGWFYDMIFSIVGCQV